MADRSIDIAFNLKEQQAVASLEKFMGGLVKTVVSLKAAKAAIDIVVGAFKDFAKSEQISAKLSAVLQSTGRAAQGAAGKIDAYAETVRSYGIYTDDAVKESAALVATFQNISTSAMPAVLDAAQDLAAFMGTDLTSATQSLAMALENPAEGLTRLRRQGIMFTEAQEKTIKALYEGGDAAGAQSMVLDVLGQKIGTVAETMAKTTQGELTRFGNLFGDVKKLVGGFAAELAGPAIKAINDWMAKILEAKRQTDILKAAYEGTRIDAGLEDIVKALAAARAEHDRISKIIASRNYQLKDEDALYAAQKNAASAIAELQVQQYNIQQQIKRAAEEEAAARAQSLPVIAASTTQIEKAVEAQLELRELDDRAVGSKYMQVLEKDAGKATEAIAETSKALDTMGYKAMMSAEQFGRTLSFAGDVLGQTSGLIVQYYQNEIDAAEKAGKETKQLRLKQWEAQKAAAIANTIFQTVIAAMRAYAEFGPVGGAIAAGIVGSIGAAQVGIINAQPAPQFRMGADFTVPQGYEGDRYTMRVSSGEHVKVTPRGESDGDPIRVTINLDRKTLYSGIYRATKNREIIIDAGAVI
jgi:hypothetical protein